MTDYRPPGASPTDLPAWTGNLSAPNRTAQHNGNHSHNGNGAARHNGADHDGGRHNGHAPVADYEAVQELRDRVSTRLTSEGGASYEALDAGRGGCGTGRWSWRNCRHGCCTGPGRAAGAEHGRRGRADRVRCWPLGGLGRLEPLLLCDDVEDIFFNGTAPTMLRLSDGRKVQGPTDRGQQRGAEGDDPAAGHDAGRRYSREFSDARPLMALRLKAVGDLGARLSAATDVTPNPAGTIRVHRHAEGDLDVAYALRMIDAPLREFLRAQCLGGREDWHRRRDGARARLSY